MTDVRDILPIVKQAVYKQQEWLSEHVISFPVIERDDLEGYARLLAIIMIEGKCRCERGGIACSYPTYHALPDTIMTEDELRYFIFNAVNGRRGLKTNSIAQGMLYPFLHEDYGLFLVKVGIKQCPSPQCHLQGKSEYEGSACANCRQLFDPCTTPVVAKDRLVIQGVYQPGPRKWACGKKHKAHYYDQDLCREQLVDDDISEEEYDFADDNETSEDEGTQSVFHPRDEERYLKQLVDDDPMDTRITVGDDDNSEGEATQLSFHVHHHSNGQTHDCCLLTSCVRYGQRHNKRGTTLWWRTTFAKPFSQEMIGGI